MRKVSVYADIEHREEVLRKLEEVGNPFFHVTECVVKGRDRRVNDAEERRELHIEVLIEAHEVEDTLRAMSDQGIRVDAKRIAVSEVFASPVFEGSSKPSSTPPREIKWGDYLITL
jgi:vacuolar-type H+-ATPase subunit I/STV1